MQPLNGHYARPETCPVVKGVKFGHDQAPHGRGARLRSLLKKDLSRRITTAAKSGQHGGIYQTGERESVLSEANKAGQRAHGLVSLPISEATKRRLR